MLVVRKKRAVLQAHRLPERLDRETSNFATKNQLAISELPGRPGAYAVFNLRWNITASHVTAQAGQYIVLDAETRVLTPEEYLKDYETISREMI